MRNLAELPDETRLRVTTVSGGPPLVVSAGLADDTTTAGDVKRAGGIDRSLAKLGVVGGGLEAGTDVETVQVTTETGEPVDADRWYIVHILDGSRPTVVTSRDEVMARYVSDPLELERLARLGDSSVRAAVAENYWARDRTIDTLGRLVYADDPARAAVEARTRRRRQVQTLAQHDDPKVRGAVAQRGDAGDAVLRQLAEDPDPDVRAAVAQNVTTPTDERLRMALNDPDETIRENAGDFFLADELRNLWLHTHDDRIAELYERRVGSYLYQQEVELVTDAQNVYDGLPDGPSPPSAARRGGVLMDWIWLWLPGPVLLLVVVVTYGLLTRIIGGKLNGGGPPTDDRGVRDETQQLAAGRRRKAVAAGGQRKAVEQARRKALTQERRGASTRRAVPRGSASRSGRQLPGRRG